MTEQPEEFRPRFGRVLRADGTTQVCYFRPAANEEDVFEPVDPSTEKVIELKPGDSISFDRLGAHQGIRVLRGDNQMHEGRTRPGWRNKMDENQNSQPRHRRDSSWAGVVKGIITLFVLGGFILGMAWGFKAIFG